MKFLNYQKYIEEGLINKVKHTNLDLWILNYSKKCQYERCWDSITSKCRGLILDGNDNIVARPFEKFFNWEELDEATINKYSRKTPKVFSKEDGSLGILYKHNGNYFLATRGSFNSEQAIYGTFMLNKHYSKFLDSLNTDEFTYLFEIIFKKNKIVLEYEEEKLILLDILKIEDGSSHLYLNPGFETPKEINWSSYQHLKEKDIRGEEGYVLKYDDGYRIKIKFDNYVKMHYLVHHISNMTIWETLSLGGDIYKLIEELPDEMHLWIKLWVDHFEDDFTHYKYMAFSCFDQHKGELKTSRKNFAIKVINECLPEIRSSMFAMADNKYNDSYIWELIKPIKKQFFKDEND